MRTTTTMTAAGAVGIVTPAEKALLRPRSRPAKLPRPPPPTQSQPLEEKKKSSLWPLDWSDLNGRERRDVYVYEKAEEAIEAPPKKKLNQNGECSKLALRQESLTSSRLALT